jgi:hypothetical protein
VSGPIFGTIPGFLLIYLPLQGKSMAKAMYQREHSGGKGAVANAAEEQEEDVVESQVSETLVFPSSACGEDVGETKCHLFCSETLCFTNKQSIYLYKISTIRSSRSSYSIHIRDLSQTSSRSNVTRKITSTSNVTVQKRFMSSARRSLEREKYT